jgi:hypothetical protein
LVAFEKRRQPAPRQAQRVILYGGGVDGGIVAAVTLRVAEASTPPLSFAVTLWSPVAMSSGMVTVVVNAPVASVVMVEFEARGVLFSASVTFWLLPKPEPEMLTPLPALTDAGVSTRVAMLTPGMDVEFPVVVSLPAGAVKVELPGDVSLPGGTGVVDVSFPGGAVDVALPLGDVALPDSCTANIAVAPSPLLPVVFISWSPAVAFLGIIAVMENSPMVFCVMLFV